MINEPHSTTENPALPASRSRWALWIISLVVVALILSRVNIALIPTMSPIFIFMITGSLLALAANYFAQVLGVTRSPLSIIKVIIVCLTMTAAEHFFSWQQFCAAENEKFYAELKQKPAVATMAKDQDWGPQTPTFFEFMQRGENLRTQWLKWIGFALVEQIAAVGLFVMLSKSADQFASTSKQVQ